MKCKDCLKQDVCGFYYDYLRKELRDDKIVNCEFFTDKGKIIEVPCKIGDEIYEVAVFDDSYSRIAVYHIQDVSAKFIYYADDVIKHSDIGDIVFLDLDQAREKLREMKG